MEATSSSSFAWMRQSVKKWRHWSVEAKSARRRESAHILLKADQSPEGPAWNDSQIAEALDVRVATIHRSRQVYVEQGLEAALERKRRTDRQYRKLDGVQEAKRVTSACSPPPHGQARWTIELLADKLVELEIVDSNGV